MKLHQVLFWFLIFLLPTQAGKHFWPDFSSIYGLRIDYFSPTAYLTDFITLGIFITWLAGETGNLKAGIRVFLRKGWFLAIPLLCLLITGLIAVNSGAAITKFVKILELCFLGTYVARNRGSFIAVRQVLPLVVIYSSLVALVQLIKQASIGGLFWWMGERTFSLITPGIAKTTIFGNLVMRPYATFSHPNQLAGFILVSLVLIMIMNEKRKLVNTLAFLLGIITIIISFSRSAWMAGFLVALFYFLKFVLKKMNRRLAFLMAAASLSSLTVLPLLVIQLIKEETVTQRLELAKSALLMAGASPLFGVGLNNFIAWLPLYWGNPGSVYWLQPVHNIFLLTTAETGLFGLIVFLCFLFMTFLRMIKDKRWLLLPVTIIIFLGLFDHYWITLQQTQFLFAIVIGLGWSIFSVKEVK